MKKKCSVCKRKTKYFSNCSTCNKIFCVNHLYSTGCCWACARLAGLVPENHGVCELCRSYGPVDIQATPWYNMVVCFRCSDRLNQEYIAAFEDTMKHIKGII